MLPLTRPAVTNNHMRMQHRIMGGAFESFINVLLTRLISGDLDLYMNKEYVHGSVPIEQMSFY